MSCLSLSLGYFRYSSVIQFWIPKSGHCPIHYGASASQTALPLHTHLCAKCSEKDAVIQLIASWQPQLFHFGELKRIEVKNSAFQENIRLNSGCLKKKKKQVQSSGFCSSLAFWEFGWPCQAGVWAESLPVSLCPSHVLPSCRWAL